MKVNNWLQSDFIMVFCFSFQVIDSKKKNFHHEGDSGFLRQQGAINNANYGSTRRTLGTRFVKLFTLKIRPLGGNTRPLINARSTE